MPSYNTGRFIKETIESVLAQTYSNWELLIVDDCSKDNTDARYKHNVQFVSDRIKLDSVLFYNKVEENKNPHNWKNPVWQHADGSVAEW